MKQIYILLQRRIILNLMLWRLTYQIFIHHNSYENDENFIIFTTLIHVGDRNEINDKRERHQRHISEIE